MYTCTRATGTAVAHCTEGEIGPLSRRSGPRTGLLLRAVTRAQLLRLASTKTHWPLKAPANARGLWPPNQPATLPTLLPTPCSANPISRPAYLQAQGGPAASQELTNVAQALALAPGLRVDLQHRAQAMSEGGKAADTPRNEPAVAPAGGLRGRSQTGEPGGSERLVLACSAAVSPHRFPSSGLHQSQAPSLTRK